MTCVVTGDINSGKTARMRALFERARQAGGILSEKIYENNLHTGYRLVSLDSDETAILALKREAYDGRFTQACRLGDYVFSEEAFRLGNGILRRLTEDPAVRAVFLDEAGPLELSGRGFAESLPALARSEKDLFIAVRAGCLADFLRTYEIENPRIIPVSP